MEEQIQNPQINKVPFAMTGAIILAAGSSSRMGQSKQMLEIHGESLLSRTVNSVLASKIDCVVVVLGANEAAHRELLSGSPVDISFNPRWQKGMGSSIKTGLRLLQEKHAGIDSVVILVCDQPFLGSEVITALLEKHRDTKKPIVASGYSDVPGVPVMFSRSYFQELADLPDDEGAKKIIRQHPSDVIVVPFPGGEIDLDTMDDYRTFLGSREKK